MQMTSGDTGRWSRKSITWCCEMNMPKLCKVKTFCVLKQQKTWNVEYSKMATAKCIWQCKWNVWYTFLHSSCWGFLVKLMCNCFSLVCGVTPFWWIQYSNLTRLGFETHMSQTHAVNYSRYTPSSIPKNSANVNYITGKTWRIRLGSNISLSR